MSLTMAATGIGHTGTQTRSSIASNSCSVKLSDFHIPVFSYFFATIIHHKVDHKQQSGCDNSIV